MLPLLDKPFEFATDIPLEECQELLQALAKPDEREGWFAPPWPMRVELKSDDTPVRFRIEERGPKGNIVALLSGTLSSASSATIVTGHAHISPLTLGCLSYFALAGISIIFAFGSPALILFGIFALAFTAWLGYGTFKSRNDLIALLRTTLSDR